MRACGSGARLRPAASPSRSIPIGTDLHAVRAGAGVRLRRTAPACGLAVARCGELSADLILDLSAALSGEGEHPGDLPFEAVVRE